jgi:hypothetical protein
MSENSSDMRVHDTISVFHEEKCPLEKCDAREVVKHGFSHSLWAQLLWISKSDNDEF